MPKNAASFEGRLTDLLEEFLRNEVAAGADLAPLAKLLRDEAADALIIMAAPAFRAEVRKAVDRALRRVRKPS